MTPERPDALQPQPGRAWTVRIDGWQPFTLNQLLHCHWQVRRRLKRHDADILAAALGNANVPRATGKRTVGLEILLGPRQRGADPDAYWKSLLDGLKKAGAIVDDSRRWCSLKDVTYTRAPKHGAIITLADVLHEPPPIAEAPVSDSPTIPNEERL